MPGVPDLFVLYRGRLIGIELKSPKGQVSRAQRLFGMLLEAAGGVVVYCRSLEQVIEALTELQVPLRARIAA